MQLGRRFEKENNVLWALLDQRINAVRWETAIGRMRSACDDTTRGFTLSFRTYSILKYSLQEEQNLKLFSELKLELVRREHYPHCVSRLTGMFYFLDRETAIQAIPRWKFRPSLINEISEVNVSSEALSLHDSEWVTYNWKKWEDEAWMHSYWKGEVYGSSPLVEAIVSGIGVVVDRNLREQAFLHFMEHEPQVIWMLSPCAAAFYMGVETAGEVKPGLLLNDGTVTIDFYVYIGDFNEGDGHRYVDAARSRGVTFPMPGREPPAVPNFSDPVSFSTDAKLLSVMAMYGQQKSQVR